MSHAGKILALLLVVSLGAEASASSSEPILFFGRQSYKNMSWVDVKCTEHLPDQNRTKCELRIYNMTLPSFQSLATTCPHEFESGRNPFKPDSMQVIRFGDSKAILSWQADSTRTLLSSWRLAVVHVEDTVCRWHHTPMSLINWKFQPVKFIVHKDRFSVVIYSEFPHSPCAIPNSGRDVPRCVIHFNNQAVPSGPAQFWFYQDERDDNMILEPLEYENPESGYLLIDTTRKPNEISVRAFIVKPDGLLLLLRSYEIMLDTRSANPYDNVAYSTVNGIIGICVETKNNQLICSQFDRDGKKRLEKWISVKRKNNYYIMNLPRPGGMLLLNYTCTDPENLCNMVDSITISISKIESYGAIARDIFKRKELYTCNKKLYRGDVQLFDLGLGHYCYTQVCLGYPKDSKMMDPLFYPICFIEQSKQITYDLRTGYAYFNHHSYKNTTHLMVFCGMPALRNDSFHLCEVSRYVDQRLQKTCEVWLDTGAIWIKPEHMQVMPFNDDKAILSWQAYANELHGAWRLLVVHFEDCSSYQPNMYKHFYVPTNIIVYDNWFAAVVTSTIKGPCEMPHSIFKVSRCELFFDGLGEDFNGPLLWWVQDERDDDMTLVPLEYENSKHRHLLIETSTPNTSSPVIACVYLIDNSAVLHQLDIYELTSEKSANPHDAIAYSTANGFIGICAEVQGDQLTCSQFDRNGKQTLEKTFQIAPKQGFAVINLAKPGGMLLLHYVCTDPQSRCENRNSLVVLVSRIENDKDTPQPVFHSFETYQCDRRYNKASAQLFMKDSGQYCFTQVCYRNPDDPDNFYRPVIFSTCLPEKALEATADHKMDFDYDDDDFV